jgi:hypothetical protein
MDNEDRNDYQYCSCVWCGNWITRFAFEKRKERKRTDADVCKDCRDTRKSESLANKKKFRNEHKTLGILWCVLWNGELNEDWLPIDDEGQLFMPGHRICDLKDCVNSNHVIAPKTATVSDIDLILMSMEVRKKHKTIRTT